MNKDINQMTYEEIEKEIKTYSFNTDDEYAFVSYSHADKEIVVREVLKWKRKGYNIYIDFDFENHASNEDWIEIMQGRLRSTNCVMAVVFLSQEYYYSYASFIELLTMRSKKTINDRNAATSAEIPIDIITIGNVKTPDMKIFKSYKEKYKEKYDDMIKNMGKSVFDGRQAEKDALLEGLKVFKDKEQVWDRIKNAYSKSASDFYPTIAKCMSDWFVKFKMNGNYKNINNTTWIYNRFKENDVHCDEKRVNDDGVNETQFNQGDSVETSVMCNTNTSVPNQNEVYFNGAIGHLNGLGGIIVKRGSIISKEEASSCSDTAHRLRRQALEAGELREENGHYVLLADKEFKSLSGAAGFVSGYSVNGKIAWKAERKGLVNEILTTLSNQALEVQSKEADENLEEVTYPAEDNKPNEVYFNGAIGHLNGLGGIIVKSGSIISKEEAASCSDTAHRLRKQALEAGELREENGHYVLLVDKEFKSLSGAAGFVSGYSVNGKIAWKAQQGSKNINADATSKSVGVSSKMNQILMVIEKVIAMPRPIFDYSQAFSQAAGMVADELQIGKSSVVDKCQRQLNLSAYEFRSMLMGCIEHNDSALYDLLMNHAVNEDEKEAIKRVVKR